MSTLQFEDVHEFSPGEFYYAPNEGVLEWSELFKDIHVSRAAGICSSGEIGLLAMLPHVEDELLLVDHSYNSLWVAITKYLLLQELGADEAYKALCSNAAKDQLNKMDDKMPFKCELDTTRAWVNSSEIPNCWKKLPVEFVREAESRLDRVKFLHGDMRDLVDRGPFEFVYLSNAIDRMTSRHGYSSQREAVLKAVAPGGFVALAVDHYKSARAIPAGWTEVARTDSKSGTMNWAQQLLQRDEGSASV